jgi:hypothetical protein
MRSESTLAILVDLRRATQSRPPSVLVHLTLTDGEGTAITREKSFDLGRGHTRYQRILLASTKALEFARQQESLHSVSRITVFAHSYVVANVGQAMFEWPRRKWSDRRRRPIPNSDFWKMLIREMSKMEKRIDFRCFGSNRSY